MLLLPLPLLLRLLLPQPLWLRPTRRIRSDSPRRAPLPWRRVGDTSEMRDARWLGESRQVRCERRRNEIKGRVWAGRWRPGDPGMRLPSRLDLRSAGGRKACRDRDRLPGGGCRLSRGGERVELTPAIAPVHLRKGTPLAQTRHLQLIFHGWEPGILGGLHQSHGVPRQTFASQAVVQARANQRPVDQRKLPRARPVGWTARERDLGWRGPMTGSHAARTRATMPGRVVELLFKWAHRPALKLTVAFS